MDGAYILDENGNEAETGEIEAVMKEVPGVTDAIVKDFSSNKGSVYICGFYISDDSVTKEVLTEALKKKLPDYMIPGFFVKMDAFPVNANGKLDRFALPDPKSL